MIRKSKGFSNLSIALFGLGMFLVFTAFWAIYPRSGSEFLRTIFPKKAVYVNPPVTIMPTEFPSTSDGRCGLIPDPGPCEGFFQSFYFDQEESICKETHWGGCYGVDPFQSLSECQAACDKQIQSSTKGWETYSNEEYGLITKYYPESEPTELMGTEEEGQFTYLLLINFGTNPLKFPYGYELRISKEQSTSDFRQEIIGHVADEIKSEKEVMFNNITWTKINYDIFLTTEDVPISKAVTQRDGYSFSVTSSSYEIDQILSTFKFTN